MKEYRLFFQVFNILIEMNLLNKILNLECFSNIYKWVDAL